MLSRVKSVKNLHIPKNCSNFAAAIHEHKLGYTNPFFSTVSERDYKPIGRSDDHDEFEQTLKKLPEKYVDINQIYEAIQKQKEKTRRQE